MQPLYLVLLTLTVLLPSTATAQAPGDTLPERVVERAYEAFNRHDAAAYMSFFAPRLTLESVRPDSLCQSRRTSREAEQGVLSKEFAPGGVFSTTKAVARRRFVAGPFVVEEQAIAGKDGGVVHLHIFEVKRGHIIREIDFDAYGPPIPPTR
jgi:hypothetical protein